MSIGLFDADMAKYSYVPFNLELMKLSTYYKNKGEIVGLSPSFSPNMYSKFIYRKDYYDGYFPSEILKEDNIEYGGRAFNVDSYQPLDEEIERLKPDLYIYDKMKKDFSVYKIREKAFNVMQRAEHLRLSLDGKTIWKDFEKQIKLKPTSRVLFLHDYNLNNIENSDIIITELMKNMHKTRKFLANKFPIQVDNDKDLFKWTKFSPSKNFFLLQYNGIMNDEVFFEFIEKQKGTSISSQTEYFITKGCKDEEDFIQNRLTQIYRQLTYLKMNRTSIILKYENNFFRNKQWERLIDFFQNYLKTTISLPVQTYDIFLKYDTLYNYAAKVKEKDRYMTSTFNRQEVRELFQLVRENNYECFRDFYECPNVKLIGGTFQPWKEN